MYWQSKYRQRRRELERTDRPLGLTRTVRRPRGGVSPWLLPSRRGDHADRVAVQVRVVATLAGIAWILAAAFGSATGSVFVFLVGAAWCTCALPGPALWLRTGVPALVGIAWIGVSLLQDVRVVRDPWTNLLVVTLAIVAALAREAMKVDAVRRMSPPEPGRIGEMERITPLRLPGWLDGLGVATLCSAGVLLFAFVALIVLVGRYS